MKALKVIRKVISVVVLFTFLFTQAAYPGTVTLQVVRGNNAAKVMTGTSADKLQTATINAQNAVAVQTVINDAAGLQQMSKNLNGHYVLGCNIDLSGSTWNPIGDSSNPFAGIFDGNGYSISNLSINYTATGPFGYAGFFGYMSGATVEDVTFKNVSVTGNGYAHYGSNGGDIYVGALAGYGNSSTIKNVDVIGGSVAATAGDGRNWIDGGYSGGSAYAGGLVGQQNGGAVSGSSASVNVSATGGNGVYGTNGTASPVITYDSNGNPVVTWVGGSGGPGGNGGNVYVGGLVGNVLAGAVSNSDTSGKVTGTAGNGGEGGYGDRGASRGAGGNGGNVYIGYVAGKNTGTITNVSSTGYISGIPGVHGIGGANGTDGAVTISLDGITFLAPTVFSSSGNIITKTLFTTDTKGYTRYDYYDEALYTDASGNHYGRVKRATRPDGTFDVFTYAGTTTTVQFTFAFAAGATVSYTYYSNGKLQAQLEIDENGNALYYTHFASTTDANLNYGNPDKFVNFTTGTSYKYAYYSTTNNRFKSVVCYSDTNWTKTAATYVYNNNTYNRLQSVTLTTADILGNKYYHYTDEDAVVDEGISGDYWGPGSRFCGRVDKTYRSTKDADGCLSHTYTYYSDTGLLKSKIGYATTAWGTKKVTYAYFNNTDNRIQSKTLVAAGTDGVLYRSYMDENWNGQGYGRVSVEVKSVRDADLAKAYQYEYYSGTSQVHYKYCYSSATYSTPSSPVLSTLLVLIEYASDGSLISKTKPSGIAASTTLTSSDINLPGSGGYYPGITTVSPATAKVTPEQTTRGVTLTYSTSTGGWAGGGFNYTDPMYTFLGGNDFSGLRQLVIGLQGSASKVKFELVDTSGKKASVYLTGISSTEEKVWSIATAFFTGQGINMASIAYMYCIVEGTGLKGTLQITRIAGTEAPTSLKINPSTTYTAYDINLPRPGTMNPLIASGASVTTYPLQNTFFYNTGTAGWAGASLVFDVYATAPLEVADLSGMSNLILGTTGTSSAIKVEVEDSSQRKAVVYLTGATSGTQNIWAIPISTLSSQGIDISHVEFMHIVIEGSNLSGSLQISVNNQ